MSEGEEMDREQLENIIRLNREGHGEQSIAQKLNMSHGIAGWYLLFIRVHGENAARNFNLRIDRPVYSNNEILGIHNYVLSSKCGYERAEVYFKITRNRLREKLKKLLGKEGLSSPAPAGVPMEPRCAVIEGGLLGKVRASTPVGGEGFEGLSLQALAAWRASWDASWGTSWISEGLASESAAQADSQDSATAYLKSIQDRKNSTSFNLSLWKTARELPDKPCIFGRARETVKKYTPENRKRRKGRAASDIELALSSALCSGTAVSIIAHLCCKSVIEYGLYLSAEFMNLMYASLLNESGILDASQTSCLNSSKDSCPDSSLSSRLAGNKSSSLDGSHDSCPYSSELSRLAGNESSSLAGGQDGCLDGSYYSSQDGTEDCSGDQTELQGPVSGSAHGSPKKRKSKAREIRRPLNIVEAVDYFLGKFPARVPASSYDPQSRAPLPRIDTRSAGFMDLPERHRINLLQREKTELEIRAAAAELIKIDDVKTISDHELVKWRYRTACTLIDSHPEWKPATIKMMVGITSRQFNYYKENPDSLDPYAVIEDKLRSCFYETAKGQAGCRLMTVLLRKHYGIYLARATVRKLMKRYGLHAF